MSLNIIRGTTCLFHTRESIPNLAMNRTARRPSKRYERTIIALRAGPAQHIPGERFSKSLPTKIELFSKSDLEAHPCVRNP